MTITDPELARELTARLRRGLAERGEGGRFLLDRVDEVISRGIEELRDDPDRRRNSSGKRVITRRAANDAEVLQAHLRTLQAYIADLPLIADRAESELQEKYGVASIIVSFATDESRTLNESRVSDVHLPSVSSADGAVLRESLARLVALVDQANIEDVETKP